jgi:hypothetical protein
MDIQIVLIALLSLLVIGLVYQKIRANSVYEERVDILNKTIKSNEIVLERRQVKIEDLQNKNYLLSDRARKAEDNLEELEEDLNDLSYYDVLEATDNEHFDKVKEHFRSKFYATTIIVGQGEPITMAKKSSKTKKE